MRRALATILIVALGVCAIGARKANAQAFGVDVQSLINPAAGGMAGVGLARPQDVQSAIFGNPSTLSQFRGTQFSIGGTWSEPTLDITHDGTVTGTPYSGKSSAQGCLLPSIGVIQDLSGAGIPGSIGIGLTALSGVSEQLTGAPGSLGTHNEYFVLGINLGAGVDLTDRLAFGATLTLGDGYAGGGFVNNSVATHDYGLRATFGFDFDLTERTTIATYYQTKLPMRFDNILYLSPPGVFLDVEVDQPDNIGIGIANSSLAGGNLLLAADVIYKSWDNCDYWRDLFDDQWTFSLGAQLTRGRIKYRLGYAFSDNPMDRTPGATINGLPLGQAIVEYYQATQASVISQHRLTGGIGFDEVLPGVAIDLFVGGMLPESHQFGTHTSESLKVWYAGGGVTWKFGPPCCN